jgi:hypothetical protein
VQTAHLKTDPDAALERVLPGTLSFHFVEHVAEQADFRELATKCWDKARDKVEGKGY